MNEIDNLVDNIRAPSPFWSHVLCVLCDYDLSRNVVYCSMLKLKKIDNTCRAIWISNNRYTLRFVVWPRPRTLPVTMLRIFVLERWSVSSLLSSNLERNISILIRYRRLLFSNQTHHASLSTSNTKITSKAVAHSSALLLLRILVVNLSDHHDQPWEDRQRLYRKHTTKEDLYTVR